MLQYYFLSFGSYNYLLLSLRMSDSSSCIPMAFGIMYCAAIAMLWSLSTGNSNTSWREGACPNTAQSAQRFACPNSNNRAAPLLVISLDGFRADYLDRFDLDLTALHRIRDCGVHAPSMRPVYPPITYVSHYTMATGLFAESHGVVDNNFTDQRTGDQFSYKDTKSKTNSSWWLGEPIWVTAKNQGKRVNVHSWVGAEVEIKGVRPDEYYGFDSTAHPIEQRIDAVLEWLSRPAQTRPDLAMLYLEEPDVAGHRSGPNSHDVRNAVARVNHALDRLMQGLHDRNLLHCTNIMVVSDHGMSAHKCAQTVKISPILQQSQALRDLNFIDDKYNMIETWVMGRISLNDTDATVEQVFDALKCLAQPKTPSKYQLYRRETQPRRFHYFNEERNEPIVMTLTPPYTVFKRERADNLCEGGEHGYDNLYPSQQATFLAQGPAFKDKSKVTPFMNTELYNLMADLLNVKPASNNGTYGALHHILRNPPGLTSNTDDLYAKAVPIEPWSDPSDRQRESAQTEMRNGEKEAAPYGLPLSLKQRGEVTAVYTSSSVSGYSATWKSTVWTAFRLSKKQQGVLHRDNQNPSQANTCPRQDLQNSNCHEYMKLGVESVHLNEPGLSYYAGKSNADELPNASVVPMYRAFQNGVWKIFWDMLDEWKGRGWTLHIVLGPVFDYASPLGLVDVPELTSEPAEQTGLRIPSHFFAVITRTDPLTSRQDDLPDVLAFILPHDVEDRSACQDDMAYLLTHSATVVDVELIAGLRFFPKLPIYDGIKLRTSLPEKLWHEETGMERLETAD